tara:strand:+ start:886 stop:1461 length:576 start_codon:yes stop_codon:yes gene_type:complete
MINQLMYCLPKIKHEYDLKCRLGNTQYIDFLFPNEIPYNKMKGTDLFGRSFIILKVGVLDLKRDKFVKTGQVFFQRYSPTNLTHPSYFYNWQGASLDGEFIRTGGGIGPPQIDLITDIVGNKLILLKEEHRACKFRNGDCKVIASMDYWENRAARIIQKYFIRARYDPKYKICQNVLNRQFDEYNSVVSRD